MKAIIVALSLRHARNSAVVDWGWKQISETTFKSPNGDIAEYISDGSGNLRGRPRGTAIHLGFRWYERRDSRVIDEMLSSGYFRRSSHV